MLKQNEPLKLWHLDEYAKCSNYAKYNWVNKRFTTTNNYLYKPIKDILESCYKDLSNLEKKILWKTVRERVHRELVILLETDVIKIENYMRLAKSLLQEVRNWYLKSFRPGPSTGIHNLQLSYKIPLVGVSITGTADALLLDPSGSRLVEITDDSKTRQEIVSSISLRAKVWILSKLDVKINAIEVYRISEGKINKVNIGIHNYEEYLFKTEKALQWITSGIKHQMYLPSVTKMCMTCPYKGICSW